MDCKNIVVDQYFQRNGHSNRHASFIVWLCRGGSSPMKPTLPQASCVVDMSGALTHVKLSARYHNLSHVHGPRTRYAQTPAQTPDKSGPCKIRRRIFYMVHPEDTLRRLRAHKEACQRRCFTPFSPWFQLHATLRICMATTPIFEASGCRGQSLHEVPNLVSRPLKSVLACPTTIPKTPRLLRHAPQVKAGTLLHGRWAAPPSLSHH